MNKNLQVLTGTILGGLLIPTLITQYLNFTYPDYYRDSGMPPFIVASFFGCLPGAAIGAIVGALWPCKKP